MNDMYESMDRVIRRPLYRRYLAAIVIGMILLLLLGFVLIRPTGNDGNVLRVDRGTIDISTVRRGVFERYISTRGAVDSRNMVVLNAAVGGSVEEIFIQPGDILEKDQRILRMSNPQLEINVLEIEGDILRQSSLLTATEVNLNNSRADLTQRLLQVEQEMHLAKLRLARNRELLAKDLVNESEVIDDQARLDNLGKQQSILQTALEVEQDIRGSQLADLRGAEAKLNSKLELANSYVEELLVRAPINGEVVDISSRVDEVKAVGDELATIIDRNTLYLLAEVDEFLSDRISAGNSAYIEYNAQIYPLSITMVRPKVTDGKIEVELDFSEQPENLRIGQSFPLRISYGNSKEALLMNNDPFINDSGGRWVFVLDENGNRAVRREIEIGERNSQTIEVVSGLQIGDRIISSSYREYQNVDTIILE